MELRKWIEHLETQTGEDYNGVLWDERVCKGLGVRYRKPRILVLTNTNPQCRKEHPSPFYRYRPERVTYVHRHHLDKSLQPEFTKDVDELILENPSSFKDDFSLDVYLRSRQRWQRLSRISRESEHLLHSIPYTPRTDVLISSFPLRALHSLWVPGSVVLTSHLQDHDMYLTTFKTPLSADDLVLLDSKEMIRGGVRLFKGDELIVRGEPVYKREQGQMVVSCSPYYQQDFLLQIPLKELKRAHIVQKIEPPYLKKYKRVFVTASRQKGLNYQLRDAALSLSQEGKVYHLGWAPWLQKTALESGEFSLLKMDYTTATVESVCPSSSAPTLAGGEPKKDV